MEESKEAQAAPQVSNPPSTAPSLPPQPPPPPPPPAPASAALPPKSKKRPLESDAHVENCPLFKTRAIIRDFRPRFIEVLRTPDLQKCQASNEIREQLKILVELCKQQNGHESKPSSESKIPSPVALEKQQVEDGESQGTYIVGGSAFGWKFIIYSSKQVSIMA